MVSVASPIPPGAFVPTANKQPAVYLHNGRPQFDGQTMLLTEACEGLGVNKHQLAALLGAPEPNYVYHWVSGQRFISTLYLARLSWLLVKRLQGLETHKIKSIDWETSDMIWRTNGPESTL